MPQSELLKQVLRVLEGAGIEYMATGSVVSSLQGEPRATHDIDLIVALKPQAVPKLVTAFPSPQYYLEESGIREAIRRRGMFNLVETTEGDKVDFWLLTDDPFDRSRFSRRRTEEVLGVRMFVSSPEDTILAKLAWAKKSGGSERHFTDALRVYEVQSDRLDRGYLETWAQRLSVDPWLRDIQEKAEKL